MDEIRAQCDRIHDAVETMELVVASRLSLKDDAEAYRTLLGEVDGASLRVYQFRKALLQQARAHASGRRAMLAMERAREEGGDDG